MTLETILAAMIALPAAHYPRGLDPETEQERQARYETIAQAISQVSRRAVCEGAGDAPCERIWPGSAEELAAALVTVAWHESRFVLRVHQGKCRRDECDARKGPGGAIYHLARGLWQVHSSGIVPRDVWRSSVGTTLDRTTTAAWGAALALSHGRRTCAKAAKGKHGWVAPTFSSYATGFSCAWSGSFAREQTYRRVLSKVVASGS